jgi:hypothetical protein
VEGDLRGHRVALVADELVNPRGAGIDALAVLEAAGWGVIQLPAAWYEDDVAAPLLEQIAEHVEEFVRHGYDVVSVGDRPGLAAALAAVGVPARDQLPHASAGELRDALAARPAPAAAAGPTRPGAR